MYTPPTVNHSPAVSGASRLSFCQVANLPNLCTLHMSRFGRVHGFSVPERRPSIGCEIQSDCRTEDVWGRAAIQLACPTAKALRSSCGKTSKAFGEALPARFMASMDWHGAEGRAPLLALRAIATKGM